MPSASEFLSDLPGPGKKQSAAEFLADIPEKPMSDTELNKLSQMTQGTEAMPFGANPPTYGAQTVGNFSQGALAGLKREPPPGSDLASKVGQFAGRIGPAVAGGIAAGALTGGAAWLPAAASQALGAAGGEAYGQLASRALGGNAPGTPEEAAGEIKKEGLWAALAETGLHAVGHIAAKIVPQAADLFTHMPSESVKYAIDNPESIPMGGPGAREVVQRRAVESLKSLQGAMISARQTAGKAVETALDKFHEITGGMPVFDVRPALRDAFDSVVKFSQEAPVQYEAVKSEIEPLLTRLAEWEKSPVKTAKEMIDLRRGVDTLSGFGKKMRGVARSPEVQAILGDIGSSLRQSIHDVAQKFNFGELDAANSGYHQVASDFDVWKNKIFSDPRSDLHALSRVDNLKKKFFDAGGMAGTELRSLGEKFPGAEPAVKNLLGDLSGLSFTENPRTVDVMRDFIKFIASPANIGRGIALNKKIAGLIRSGVIAAAAPKTAGPQP